MEPKFDPKLVEEKIYKDWEKNGLNKPNQGKPFTILMPPPNANASLHAGHGMYTVEDILIRYKRLQGFATLWVPGTDHADLGWVEVEDVARMALYLAGPGSGAVNGAALSIDGGWLAA